MSGNTTVGVVETHLTHLTDFRLENGAELAQVDVAWESCGLPHAGAENAVFICHALTGDAHVAGRHVGETESSGWWDGIVGPGKSIDTARYPVICANVLGGCKGTTGPSSINPATGKPYGSAFPHFTLGDTVALYRALLKEIGVRHLAAIVGGSFGGVQVLEWITAYPDDADRAVMIAAGAALNAQALAFDIVGRAAIMRDEAWRGGDYYGGAGPRTGLAQARQVAHITYLSLDLWNRRFGRKLQQDWVEKGEAFAAARRQHFQTLFALESYLGYQAEKFLARFDANSYLGITHALDLYDATVKYGSMAAVAARIKAKVLLISISGDWLFSAKQSQDIARALLEARKCVSYAHLDIKVGHDGFLTHQKELARVLGGFFQEAPRTVTHQKRARLKPVTDMVRAHSRVLDIGCGSGSTLTLLREKGVVGTGVEIDPEKINNGIAAGLSILYDDADEGLGVIPDAAYDMAVLSETLQTVKKPRELLRNILNKAREAVVSFPNFAALGIRLHLGLTGSLPVSRQLPFQWYDTPNVHCVTLKDFRALCRAEGIRILEIKAEAGGILGKILIALGFLNLGASRIVARIAR